MNDATNPNTQNAKAGRTGVDEKQDQTDKHSKTPSDKGTPRVDQGHDKGKGAGARGNEQESSHAPGQERRPGRDADADRAAGSDEGRRSANVDSADESDDEAGDSSKTMKHGSNPTGERAKNDQGKSEQGKNDPSKHDQSKNDPSKNKQGSNKS